MIVFIALGGALGQALDGVLLVSTSPPTSKRMRTSPKAFFLEKAVDFDHEYLLSLLTYDEPTGCFTWKGLSGTKSQLNGTVAGCDHNCGYVSIGIKGKAYLAHRLAWFYVNKEWPQGNLDHIDRNPKNNRISNLRIATQSQNCANQKSKRKNSLLPKGVSFRKDIQKWRARIMVNKKEIGLGVYETIEGAIAAYKSASIKYFGEFSYAGDKDA